jgi:hypothetical protein
MNQVGQRLHASGLRLEIRVLSAERITGFHHARRELVRAYRAPTLNGSKRRHFTALANDHVSKMDRRLAPS